MNLYEILERLTTREERAGLIKTFFSEEEILTLAGVGATILPDRVPKHDGVISLVILVGEQYLLGTDPYGRPYDPPVGYVLSFYSGGTDLPSPLQNRVRAVVVNDKGGIECVERQEIIIPDDPLEVRPGVVPCSSTLFDYVA